jgi:hypothetical protein
MRFVVPVTSVYARPNPKYFGRRGGATWLNMINDQAAGLGGKVVAGTPRDSLYVLDVLYDPARRRDRALRTDCQDPAHPALGRRAWLPSADQGAGQPPGGPPLPGPEDLPRTGRTALPALPGRYGGPDRRARTGPQRPCAVHHPIHGRGGNSAAGGRLRRPRRGRDPPLAVRTAPRQHARPVLVPAARPAWRPAPAAGPGTTDDA